MHHVRTNKETHKTWCGSTEIKLTLSEFKLLSNWELGFYDLTVNKITVFNQLEKGDFAIKPADDVFKEEATKIEELDQINKVTLGFDEVKSIFESKAPEFFPQELLGGGFIILQKLNGKVMWNVTFITRTVKFANLKIDAESGEIIAHDLINFVEKQLKKK